MNHYVYQIISMTPNEEGVCRIYSGLRSCECNPEEDTEYMGSGIAIKGAIEKYGRDKFMKLIIAKFDNREEAHDCETAWLEKQFDFHGRDWTKFSKFNYNLRMNVNDNGGFCSPEAREKMSTAQSGENNPMFGKQHSDETKKKLSGGNHHKFKGLVIGTKDNQTIVFCGTADMKARGFNQGNISQVINEKLPHHKGFVFIRTSDPDQLRELLNTAEFVDEESKQRIEEFLNN